MNNRSESKYSLEGIIASIFFIALVLIVLLQVFGRTGLFAAPIWTEELARWVWIWAAFIAIAEVERKNAQLRMGIVVDTLLKRFRTAIFTILDLVYLTATVYLLWIGYKTVGRTWHNEAVTLPFTDAVMYASYPVAAVLIIYRVGDRLRSQFTGQRPYDVPAEGESLLPERERS